MRYPLIDFHGNQGAITGDGPAADRYTEARLSPIAEFGMLNKVKSVVPFIPNFDETEMEPTTLPALFPNLLCTPTTGIGVAMASSWAPHNLKEVAAAIREYIEGKPIQAILGPDFPMGGTVINKNDIQEIYKTGKGSVKIRGEYVIEGRNIVFTSVPYGVTLEKLIDSITEVIEGGEVTGVASIQDETNKEGIRIVIEPEPNEDPEVIVQRLFNKTSLQSNFSYNMMALVNGEPKLLSLKDAIQIYVDFNENIILKEATADKEKTLSRLEIVQGLLKALDIIDDVVDLIKKSESPAAAKVDLQSQFNFTERQAAAILDMKLSRLARLEGNKLKKEQEELEKLLIWLTDLIEHKESRYAELLKRLDRLVTKYGDDRRTKLTQIDVIKGKKGYQKEEIPLEDVVVILTRKGEIKRVPRINFKVQRRNTKGIKTIEDMTATVSTNTLCSVGLFSTFGKMYVIPVHKILAGTNSSRGMNLNSLIEMRSNESITAMISFDKEIDDSYVFFFTKQGMIKKTALVEYKAIARKTGIQAIKLREGDTVVNTIVGKDNDVLIATKQGMAIRFNTTDITATSRNTSGVKGLKLNPNDTVVAGFFVDPQSNILFITEDGNGKRLVFSDVPPQGRGGKGVIVYKNHKIVAAIPVKEDDEVLIAGQFFSICIAVKDISIQRRTAQGVAIAKTDTIFLASKV